MTVGAEPFPLPVLDVSQVTAFDEAEEYLLAGLSVIDCFPP
jgi:hypothetical protein